MHKHELWWRDFRRARAFHTEKHIAPHEPETSHEAKESVAWLIGSCRLEWFKKDMKKREYGL